jgi:hypothetical protein
MKNQKSLKGKNVKLLNVEQMLKIKGTGKRSDDPNEYVPD